MTVSTEITYGSVVGGYRVTFTNWNSEELFATKEDAQEFADKYTAFGYESLIQPIYLRVKVGA